MADLEERMAIIHDIKMFAVKSLGIKPNRSFRKISEVKEFFIVYASRNDRIQSVLGRCGYKIVEDEEECLQLKQRLESKGYDTLETTVEAYGTEDCPITRSMISSSKTRLTYLVLHENWHIHCVKNNIRLKPDIEEVVGDTFAYQGALLYYDSNPQMKSNVKRDFQEWQQYFEFINKYTQKIKNALSSEPSKVNEIIKSMRHEDKRLSKKFKSKELKGGLPKELNNAYFISFQCYAPMAAPVYENL